MAARGTLSFFLFFFFFCFYYICRYLDSRHLPSRSLCWISGVIAIHRWSLVSKETSYGACSIVNIYVSTLNCRLGRTMIDVCGWLTRCFSHRRSSSQKAWTQGTNPITQRYSQQNGSMTHQKQSAPTKAPKETNTSDNHAHDRLIFLVTSFIVSSICASAGLQKLTGFRA